ncbi:putative MFS transporter, AGZA family, xanthine/uracil permease [Granulicella pectinivorans]|uniref:Putative MFS transporter, AGZA family, xanthine/uracil permease n=2 Tax=Granulicella pectinivorans TaxID=474950 RepID=A0A1I6MT87_9BACT|nr:putative MFS transporter, AGZA family, xanthine/uracil permease [Granulicella pectinivorans]
MPQIETKPSPGDAALHPRGWLGVLSQSLDHVFHFSDRGSTMSREILAGMTTFSTMSYVLVVNPLVLSGTGMDRGALITATALIAAIFSIIMGLRTNYPLAMAPGMGVNAYVAVQVCQGMHIPWQAALGMVFYMGILFLLLSLTGLRQKIIEAFPVSFKKTIGAGIGLFIAFLGLRNAGIVVANPRSLVALGNVASPSVLLALGGVILAIVLVVRKVPAALILSILAVTIVGLFLPGVNGHAHITDWPQHLFSRPNSIMPVAFRLDLVYPWHHLAQSIPIILALLFTDLFSAMAVLFGVGARAQLTDADGNLPRLKQALSADAAAASGAALLGSTTAIIYLESAAGVEQGGRTGLVSMSVATCFLLALFITPIIAVIPALATTCALVMIGVFMMQGLAELDLKNIVVASTALVTLLLMTLTSVSDGLALGFIVNVVVLSAAGMRRSIKPIGWALVGLFILHYIAR